MCFPGRVRARSVFADHVRARHSPRSRPPATLPTWRATTAFVPWKSASVVRAQVANRRSAHWLQPALRFAILKTSRRFRTTVAVRRRGAEFKNSSRTRYDERRFSTGKKGSQSCKPVLIRRRNLARYKDAVCRLCRREGMKLFLKGPKCFTDKCPIEKRNFAPGQHGKDRKAKVVGYGLQLREKQKAKRIYFTQEGQFRNYFEKAARSKGVTGELLLQQLERRLDTVVFRLGFAISRRQARQIVRHGHIDVNGRRVNIPSYQVNAGDEIQVRDKAKKFTVVETAREYASHQPVANWLEVDRDNLKGRVLNLPKREDINLPVNEQLIVELYSK